MQTDADRAAQAFATAFQSMVETAPDLWYRMSMDMLAFVSGLPIASVNAVTVLGPNADLREVREALAEVRDCGHPFSLQGREALREPLASIAHEFGLTEEETVPLMVLDAREVRVRDCDVSFRELSLAQRDVHAQLMAEGFEAPLEIMEPLVELIQNSPGSRMFVAEANGQAVSTAVSLFTEPDMVGIFNVATPPRYRGHGYGTAVTVHAINAGVALGATTAWLQSSAEGHPVYRSMGFRDVEMWPSWSAPEE